MAWPTPKVEIAFNDGPYVVSPTWTDVSSYVFSADIHRGRKDDYSPFVGTAMVVLNNTARLFDPFNTAGTYYGKLLPRRQIKITGTSGGTSYPVFRGFIAGWPASFEQGGTFGTVSLQCFDALSLMAQEQMPDLLYDYTQTLLPYAYWRLNDPPGDTFLDVAVGPKPASTASWNLTKSAGTQFKPYQSAGAGITGTSADLSLSTYASVTGETTAVSNSLTLSMFVVTPPVGTSAILNFFIQGNASATEKIAVFFQSSGNISCQLTSGANTYLLTTTSNILNDARWHHFVFTLSPTAVLKIYVDGVDQATTSTIVGTMPTTYMANPVYIYAQKQAMQEIALFPGVLTAAQIAAIYNFGIANIVETSAVRFSRLVALTNFSSSLTTVTTTPVASVSAISPDGFNMASELNLVNNAEGGVMFVGKDGKINFQDRYYVYTNTKSNTSQATFATGSIPYQPNVQIAYDGDTLRNAIMVTFSGGGSIAANNVTSIAAYGRNAISYDTQLSTVTQAVDLGTYEAVVNGQLLSDVSPISVGVTANTANWNTLMGLELCERFTVTVNPSVGSAFSQIELINSIEHHIEPGRWQMVVDGSARYTGWFILDVSLLDGPDLLQ